MPWRPADGARAQRQSEPAKGRDRPDNGSVLPCRFRTPIALKLAAYLLLGTGAIFLTFGLWNIRIHRTHAEQMMSQETSNVTDVIQRSTRYHMLRNDREALERIVQDIGSEPGIRRIRIVNREGRITFSALQGDIDQTDKALSSLERPSTRIVDDPAEGRVIAMVKPIYNEKGCAGAACHESPSKQRVLGAIDTRLSLENVDKQIAAQQRQLWHWTLVALLLICAASVVFVWAVVHRRIQELKAGTKRVAGGDLHYRLTVRSNDELAELATSFNKMTAELEKAHRELIERTQNSLIQQEKMASLGKLAATVAHELNNPLFGILTYARLAMKDTEKNKIYDLEDRQRLLERLQVIERESRRCGDIVKNLLTFARQAPRKVSSQDINVLVERAIAVVRHRLTLQQVRLETSLERDLPKLQCDEGQIQQVLLALVVNAAEAMPKGGALRIESGRVENGDSEICVKVRDSGMGIPEDVMPHIFEPFFTTKTDGQGSGLGLAISHGIIAQHGGEISVQSKEGQGAEFTIALPVRRQDAAAPEVEEVACEQR
jgi:two-component system, NtrC family, sensor kinase